MDEKHTVFYDMDDFRQEVPENDYPLYFSSEEISRYARRRHKGSLAVRLALKRKLISVLRLDLDFSDLEILNDDFGRPILSGNIPQEICEKVKFSLSHGKERVVALLVITGK